MLCLYMDVKEKYIWHIATYAYIHNSTYNRITANSYVGIFKGENFADKKLFNKF